MSPKLVISFLDTFSFISRRHHQMPFGLSLYIDGLIDCRVSTCCEYKHQCGRRIGGKSAHFQLIGIDGGKPCYKCTVLSEQKAVPLQVTNKDPHATMVRMKLTALGVNFFYHNNSKKAATTEIIRLILRMKQEMKHMALTLNHRKILLIALIRLVAKIVLLEHQPLVVDQLVQ